MRFRTVALALSLSSILVAIPAFAGDKDKDASFPMPAAAFKQKVEHRQAKAREHMEKRAAQLPAEEAKGLRAKFDAGLAKINAEVARVAADGTVTKDEAQAVRKVVHEVHPHHGHHGKGGHKKQ